MLKILNCDSGSVAEKVGILPNDCIVQFDGVDSIDMLDVAYFDSQSKFSITVMRNEQPLTIRVRKPSWEPMGWNFYDECYIEPRWCANKCMFCFVDQLPKGQRKTLYVKDDDWRLSFVSGNFVTLTNISDFDIARITEKKFSPLYVSVHATDDKLRRKLLGNANARPILPLLKYFADSGIKMYTQIVMCPNLNDDQVLQKSLIDLFDLYPAVQNVAVVPVGLTKYREGLAEISPVSAAVAQETIDIVEAFAQKCFDRVGSRFAYCSDEMYVYADRELPDYIYYGDFEQIENGVGLIADFRHQFELAFADAVSAKSNSFTAICGVSAYKVVSQVVSSVVKSFPESKVNVLSVTNKFFGETVTVSGLLVGADIVDCLSNAKDVGDTILLPRVMLRENEDVFLDGMTLAEFCERTGKKVIVTADGYEFCQAILECE